MTLPGSQAPDLKSVAPYLPSSGSGLAVGEGEGGCGLLRVDVGSSLGKPQPELPVPLWETSRQNIAPGLILSHNA